MIEIKRIYDFNSAERMKKDNSLKILVDRLWPRGISKEKANINLWAKDIAPSTELRKWFNHDENKFNEFKERYFEELNSNDYAIKFKREYKNKDIVLLYSAKDNIHNNAVVLNEWLEKQNENEEN